MNCCVNLGINENDDAIMIKFNLKCSNDHRFDSWFGSNADFDRLQKRGLVSCAVCGDVRVEKALMAPLVPAKSNIAERPLSAPASAAEQAVREMRAEIEKNSDDVGSNFATAQFFNQQSCSF